ncbi:MAG: metallophosphoesterase family protein [Candidatus Riflebacteria bacterium]|nr:metallophosphoesterase family protein [Candidatus Riflebacteria bacterium]
MKIGVISDTHYKAFTEYSLPSWIVGAFESVDMIFHAGDLTDFDLVNDLSAIAPVYAVKGNMDEYRSDLPPFREIEIQSGFSVAVAHIKAEAYSRKSNSCSMIIHGHTHVPEFVKSAGMWFLNPGSPSSPRGNSEASVAILTISASIPEVEFIKRPLSATL